MHLRLIRPPVLLQRVAAAAYGIASLLCIAYVAWYANFS